MGYWKKQHGLRGSFLEECINVSNSIYLDEGLAVVQKVPTPITPVELDSKTGTIKLAYFDQKSTIDYLGNVQGIPVAFDAKETNLEYLPLMNIHDHQIRFMRAYSKQDGLSFLIISFKKHNKVFLCPFEVLDYYWTRSKKNGRKSIPYNIFNDLFKYYKFNRFLERFDLNERSRENTQLYN